jgi:hypothetical protein
MGIVDRLAVLHGSSPLLFWILGSVLAYGLVTNVSWLLRSRAVFRSPRNQWLREIGRFVFFLGIPYLVLGGWPQRPFRGLLSLGKMGLVGLNAEWPLARWLEAVGLGLSLGLAAVLFLAVAWANANRGHDVPVLRFCPRPWWIVLVDILYLEVHWAFYRSALAATLQDLYSAIFLGLGLVYVEWSLDPFWRQGWRSESQVAERWLRATLALVVALLFLLTRNLWVCLGIHLLVELVFWQLASRVGVAQPAG